MHHFTNRGIATLNDSQKSDPQDEAATATEVAPRVKFKRLDKTARHIMQVGNSRNLAFSYFHTYPSVKRPFYPHFKHVLHLQILDKEAVKEVNTQREIPDIRPGYIIQLKLVCLFLFLLIY